MEHAYNCTICDHGESWDSELSCKAAAIWHLYDMHPAVWNTESGGQRVPQALRPEHFGSRFEEWESQI